MSISFAPAATESSISFNFCSRVICAAGKPVETAAMGIWLPSNASAAKGIKL
jgi:hypothetical protein